MQINQILILELYKRRKFNKIIILKFNAVEFKEQPYGMHGVIFEPIPGIVL